RRLSLAAVLILFAGVSSPRAAAEDADKAQKKFTLPSITVTDVVEAGKLAANPGAAYRRYEERQRQRAELERLLLLIEEQERQRARESEELLRLWESVQPRWFRPRR